MIWNNVMSCCYPKCSAGRCLTVLLKMANQHDAKRLTQNDSHVLIAGALQGDEVRYLLLQPGLIKQPGDYILRLGWESLC